MRAHGDGSVAERGIESASDQSVNDHDCAPRCSGTQHENATLIANVNVHEHRNESASANANEMNPLGSTSED